MANKRYSEAEYNAMDNATLIKTLDAYTNVKHLRSIEYQFRDWVPVKVKVRYFVSKYGKDIGNAIKGTGLFFSGVVAQKMLESGYGKSDLAFYHNNFGGIKAVKGYPSVTLDTTEVVRGNKIQTKQSFAKYPSPQSAFNDYVRIITTNPRYAKALLADSPEKQILELAKAGYTTTPPVEYLNSMKGNIDRVRDMYQVGRIA